MELIKSVRRRTRVSEIIYVFLNLLLPIALFALTRAFDSPALAILLLVLSKWRVLAVRPRYWFINIKSNLADLIVGVSYVLLLVVSVSSLPVQLMLTALYIAWLMYLKPKSQKHLVAMQAGIEQFVGLTAVFMFSYQLDVVTTVLLAWLVGYGAARHALSTYDEEHLETIALCWALLIAELAWLAFHWTLSYPLVAGIAVPQVTAIATVLGFGAYNLYDNANHAKPNPRRAQLTIGVCLALFIIILVFGRWNVTV